MSERDRMRERAGWMPSRRRFLTAGAIYAAGLATDQALEQTVIEPMLEPAPRSMVSTDLKPERFAALASIEMQAGLAYWQQGQRSFPPVVGERVTRTYRHDGRRWMREQGHGIKLFAREPLTVRNIPMARQPDGQLGEWAEQRLDRCELGDAPVLQKCRVLVKTDEGLVPKMWLALLLPWKGGDVDSVTRLV